MFLLDIRKFNAVFYWSVIIKTVEKHLLQFLLDENGYLINKPVDKIQ